MLNSESMRKGVLFSNSNGTCRNHVLSALQSCCHVILSPVLTGYCSRPHTSASSLKQTRDHVSLSALLIAGSIVSLTDDKKCLFSRVFNRFLSSFVLALTKLQNDFKFVIDKLKQFPFLDIIPNTSHALQ